MVDSENNLFSLLSCGILNNMDIVAFGRAFLGMTMAFHIFFALFGVGIPLLISLAELIGIVKKDDDFISMAKRWTFAMATLFVVGAISGTIVAVVFAVLLPPFMTIVNKVVILPFFMESFAFFIEAIFLGIYAYTWGSFKGRWTHWLASLPIVIGSAASAFLITTVNAFMSSPQGFTDVNGTISNVDQWKAMFNPAVPTRTGHSILSYYATTAFVFAAIAAIRFIKNKYHGGTSRGYYEKMLVFTMAAALVFSLAVVATGDSAARYIAANQPEKFAAAENVMTTGSNVPFVFGGILDAAGRLHGDIAIPGLLSVLVGGTRNTVIRGLGSFDPSTWPPLIVHYFFDIMIMVGTLMLVVPVLFFAFRFGLAGKRRREWAFSKAVAWSVAVTGVLSVVGVEAGWMLTEIGRQPYVIQGVLLTKDAFTDSPAVIAYAVVFPIFYIVLAVVTFWILARHYRHDGRETT